MFKKMLYILGITVLASIMLVGCGNNQSSSKSNSNSSSSASSSSQDLSEDSEAYKQAHIDDIKWGAIALQYTYDHLGNSAKYFKQTYMDTINNYKKGVPFYFNLLHSSISESTNEYKYNVFRSVAPATMQNDMTFKFIVNTDSVTMRYTKDGSNPDSDNLDIPVTPINVTVSKDDLKKAAYSTSEQKSNVDEFVNNIQYMAKIHERNPGF